jgi:hypothetical protein
MKLRCQALDQNGKRCKNIAKHIEHYHGDNEIYNYEEGLTWVEIGVCNKHRKTDIESENYKGRVNINKFVFQEQSEGAKL